MTNYRFRLFIAGQTPRSQKALSNLRRVCDMYQCAYELTIVDILEHPEKAAKAKVLAIPTLDKEEPIPPCRLVGDLNDLEKVASVLNLNR